MRTPWLFVPLLAACVAAPADPELDRIETYVGSSMFGFETVKIYADDRALVSVYDPDRPNRPPVRQQLAPGAYARARAVAEAGFPLIPAEPTDIPDCPTDVPARRVTVDPPIGGRAIVADGCAEERVYRLGLAIRRAAGLATTE